MIMHITVTSAALFGSDTCIPAVLHISFENTSCTCTLQNVDLANFFPWIRCTQGRVKPSKFQAQRHHWSWQSCRKFLVETGSHATRSRRAVCCCQTMQSCQRREGRKEWPDWTETLWCSLQETENWMVIAPSGRRPRGCEDDYQVCVTVVTIRRWADISLWVAVCVLAEISIRWPTTTFARLTQSQAISQSKAFLIKSLSDQWEINTKNYWK